MQSYVDTEQMLTQSEAARFLRLEPRTLEAWRLRRIGPRFMVYSRRCIRYRKSDLEVWLKEREVRTADQHVLR